MHYLLKQIALEVLNSENPNASKFIKVIFKIKVTVKVIDTGVFWKGFNDKVWLKSYDQG